MKRETIVGMFVLASLAIVGYMTLKVGASSGFTGGNTYYVTVRTALGLSDKTPVLIAGYQAGVVEKVSLADSRRALLKLIVKKEVHLTEGTEAAVRAKGVLGETFVELLPGPDDAAELKDDATLPFHDVGGDINQLVSRLNDMAPAAGRGVDNFEKFTEVMKNLMVQNQQNVNRIMENFAALSADLRSTISGAQPGVRESVERIASITQKVDEGKGTIGKLVNDDSTVNKINEAADNINNLTGGVSRMQTEIGYHAEYMGNLKDFKNYVHLGLKPRPDQAFMIDFVSNPNPPPDMNTSQSTITVGGTSTTVNTSSLVTQRNKFRISAQMAKKFYDWRLRGGIIENRGGVGLDYMRGPVGASVDAWDFGSGDQRHPSVKVYGNMNVTKSLYLMGGGNDLANKPTRDWFVGAGVRVVDEDIKSVFGLGSGLVK
jgi:phospholipid/cholesterol/gamma-HCH transport system substrate-binding protein